MIDENKDMSTQEIQHSLTQVMEIPDIYFNGFQLLLGNSDLNALLLRNNFPVARLNMSFTTAKTLLVHLEDLMQKLERVTKHDIMTTMEVNEGLQTLTTEQGQHEE